MAKSKRYFDLECVDPENYRYTPGNHRYGLKFRSKKHRNGRAVAVIQMNGSTANWTSDKSDWKPDSTIGKVLNK